MHRADEITDVRVILSNSGGTIYDQTFNNIDDNLINDIDDLATGLSVNGVTEFDIRLIGSDGTFEVREFIIEGETAPAVVPEAGSLAIWGLLSSLTMVVYRRRRK